MSKNQNIPSQKKLIHETDWKNLIILDACRHDYCKKVYSNYLDGHFQKVVSAGGNTVEWLKKTFPNYYEIIYYSANPYVNSLGVSFNGWKATHHFSKIEDVWLYGWDDRKQTVLPKTMNKSVLENKQKKKMIVHYIQPHLPYILLGPLGSWTGPRDMAKKNGLNDKEIKKLSQIRNLLNKGLDRILGDENIWRLRKFFKIEAEVPWEKVWRRCGKNEIKYYYTDNLKRVLTAISELVEKINGKTIVTADHGELLGDNRKYGHEYGSKERMLLEVPWIEL